ncbi:hypothetical protein CVD28_06545 [Bacillus sp. M6-12]|nr:hypothetical protein CVD28_06545 [Bacillus sp. M6-12]
MSKAGKDDFVTGFVPDHNHGAVDYTSVDDGHVHQYLGVRSPPISTQVDRCTYTGSYVVYEDGHTHYYQASSGPAIPAGNGMHVH